VLPFIGHEFIAHLLDMLPNGERRAGLNLIARPEKNGRRLRMTTQTSSLNAFSVAPGQGRSHKPLNILGSDVFVKLANADTSGALAIFEHAVPPMGGPPLHRHSREDEWFYVLDGEITVEVDGERMVLPRGGSAYAPRGTVHAFQNFSATQARILVLVTPGGFHHFFEKLSPMPWPDPARLEKVAKEYGIEILGPPLT
jgi:quercetin dioxygenase-like cupin family protein